MGVHPVIRSFGHSVLAYDFFRFLRRRLFLEQPLLSQLVFDIRIRQRRHDESGDAEDAGGQANQERDSASAREIVRVGAAARSLASSVTSLASRLCATTKKRAS